MLNVKKCYNNKKARGLSAPRRVSAHWLQCLWQVKPAIFGLPFPSAKYCSQKVGERPGGRTSPFFFNPVLFINH
jgi:hypothetical protein